MTKCYKENVIFSTFTYLHYTTAYQAKVIQLKSSTQLALYPSINWPELEWSYLFDVQQSLESSSSACCNKCTREVPEKYVC